jgi:hypothetical protein
MRDGVLVASSAVEGASMKGLTVNQRMKIEAALKSICKKYKVKIVVRGGLASSSVAIHSVFNDADSEDALRFYRATVDSVERAA